MSHRRTRTVVSRERRSRATNRQTGRRADSTSTDRRTLATHFPPFSTNFRSLYYGRHHHFSYICSHICCSANTITHMSSSPSPDRLLRPRDQAFSQNGRHPSARGPHAASHAAMPVQASQHLLCLNHSSSSQAAPHPQLRQHSDPSPAPLTLCLALPREGFHPSILVLIRLANLRARIGLKKWDCISRRHLCGPQVAVSSASPATQHLT